MLLLSLWTGWAGPLPAGLPGETSLPAGYVSVDPAYTSSISGWGITHFQTLAEVGPGTAVHVAAGAALSVSGALALDGCLVDCAVSNGSFSVTLEPGSDVRLERTRFSGCGQLTVNSGNAVIRNCAFSGTQVEIGSSAEGATFLHNILLDGSALADSGMATVTQADGWSNPDSVSNAWNRMSLEWAADGLPAGRTLDDDGLFIQPGDSAGLQLFLSDLSAPVAGCEMLLGYDSEHLTSTLLSLSAPWSFDLAEVCGSGMLNAAVGLGLSAPREGTMENGSVAELVFQTLENEGRSVVYFRSADGPWDNRLASDPDGQSGAFLSPFTLNSATVTIDGTPPELQPLQAAQDGTDLLETGNSASTGTVTVRLAAEDLLAGLAGVSLSVSPELDVETVEESMDGGISGFSWELDVNDLTPSGTYTVEAVAIDRAGNAATNSAVFTVARPALMLSVAMENAVDSAYDFDVVVQALDAGGAVLESWTQPASFLEAQAVLELSGLPDETAFLTADTAVSLRRKLPVTFEDGAWLAGSMTLLGGDLNGDHIVNFFDYAVLRTHWQMEESAADINRDGRCNFLDYTVLRSNWQAVGD